MIKAILFDMDGVLADTEYANMETAAEVCREIGIELTQEEKEKVIGVTTKSFYENLEKSRNGELKSKKATEDHYRKFLEYLKKEVKSFPGAKTLPGILKKQGYKLGLVSGSTDEEIEMILSALKIKGFFNIIVSSNTIKTSKPNPEGYLLAAKKLEVRPEECLVLEDSTPGIEAGKAAGMKVIGVINNGKQNLSKADKVVENLSQINQEIDF